MIGQPRFWQKRFGLGLFLLPLSLLWWLGGRLRTMRTTPFKSNLPVICIGNLTVGGTGKTPTALLIAQLLQNAGWHPAILSRGYGGTQTGPCWVDAHAHTARDVGDEPLLLSRQLSVCVSRNRKEGARFIEDSQQHDVIIMDDGLQNPQLYKDIIFGVFDGAVGIGNGFLMPAGPMREGFSSAKTKLDAVVINGTDDTNLSSLLPADTPVFRAHLVPDSSSANLTGHAFYAFAGIGRPERFFDSLETLGADLRGKRTFADHHPYSETDLVRLQEDAMRLGAQLVTTQKDWVRLPAEWRERIFVLPVALALDDDDGDLLRHVETAITAHKDS